MADLTVSGLIGVPAAYNGDYTKSGTYNGKDVFVKDGSHCCYYSSLYGGSWALAPTPGDDLNAVSYGGSSAGPDSSNGAWADMGAGAPTVTELGGGGGYGSAVLQACVRIAGTQTSYLIAVPVELRDADGVLIDTRNTGAGVDPSAYWPNEEYVDALPVWADEAHTIPITYRLYPKAEGGAASYAFAHEYWTVTPAAQYPDPVLAPNDQVYTLEGPVDDAFVFLVFFDATWQPPAPPPRYTWGGTVRQAGTGIAGIPVFLFQGGVQVDSTTTDASGDYLFEDLLPATYTARAQQSGYTFYPAQRTAAIVDANLEDQDFVVTSAPELCSISGKVAEGATGLEGITVRLLLHLAGITVAFTDETDGNGDFSFTGLAPGYYTMSCDYDAGYTFSPTGYSYPFLASDQVDQDFAATARVASYRIQGTIAYGTGGLAGVSVVATKGGDTISTLSLADGTYTLTGATVGEWHVVFAKAGYTFDPASLDPEVVDQDVTGQDTEATLADPPVVAITEPLDAATVGGLVTVGWTVNKAVVSCEVYVDGALQTTITEGDSPFSWTWDARAWANGSHTILVVATDAADQEGSDSVTVDLENTAANVQRVLITKQVPAGDLGNWRLSSTTPAASMIVVPEIPNPPEDPALQYGVSFGIHVPGDSTNFEDYRLIEPYRSVLLPTAAPSFRVGMLCSPSAVWGYWENTDYPALTQIVPLAGGDFACLAAGAGNALLRSNLTAWEALSLTTVRGAAAVSDKILIAGDDRVVVKDLDTGELTWDLIIPGAATVDAIAAAGDTAYVAITDGNGDAALYSYTYPALLKIADLVAPAQALYASNGLVTVACSNGHIYAITAGLEPTDLYDTGESLITRLVVNNGVMWALTGSGGKLFRTTPWQIDSTFDTPTTLWGLASYADDLWVAGDSADVWRRHGSAWANWIDLEDVVAVYDLHGPGEALYLAAAHVNGARLYRLEFATAGSYLCDGEPPDVVAKVLRYA